MKGSDCDQNMHGNLIPLIINYLIPLIITTNEDQAGSPLDAGHLRGKRSQHRPSPSPTASTEYQGCL